MVLPITGRVWRWMKSEASFSFLPARPQAISTAQTAPAITSSPIACWHWMRTQASVSGTFKKSSTISGIAIFRPRLVSSLSNATARRSTPWRRPPSKAGFICSTARQGAPLFPIEYHNYPPSTVPGEVAAKTQPLPVKPEPYARQLLTEGMLTNRTPAAHQWAVEQFRKFRSNGQFIPLAVDQETVIFPGFDGGAEWGGSAFDPETGLLYVNANDLAWTASLTESHGGNSGQKVYLSNCAPCHGDSRAGAPPQIPSLVDIGSRRTPEQIRTLVRQGAGRMPSFPNLSPPEINGLLAYLVGGEDKELTSKETPDC